MVYGEIEWQICGYTGDFFPVLISIVMPQHHYSMTYY